MEFQKELFANILKAVVHSYNSISEFAKSTSVDRVYISKYINEKMKEPPSPKILRKIANHTHGVISYIALLYVCGYLTKEEYRTFTKNL